MDHKLFQKFKNLIYEVSGIALSDDKEALVSTRISKRIRFLGLLSENEYYDYLLAQSDEVIHFIDVISTNVTHFFREAEHFKILADHLQHLASSGQKEIKIWCAASSSGEEPYTIGMTCHEVLSDLNIQYKILATDISTNVLKQAIEGAYSIDKLNNIPNNLQKKYFDLSLQTGVVKQFLKNHIFFRRLNLKNIPFPLKGPIDIIFCRNVMIYFDVNLKKRIVKNMFDLLRPGGMLVTSHTESLSGISKDFQVVKPSIFIKPDSIDSRLGYAAE